MEPFLESGLTMLTVRFVLPNLDIDDWQHALEAFNDDWPESEFTLRGAYEQAGYLLVKTLDLGDCDPSDEDDFVIVDVEWRLRRRPARNRPTSQELALVDGLASVDGVLESLSSVVVDQKLVCRSSYQLGRDKWVSRIALPLLQLDIVGTRLSQVSGVQLTPERRDYRHYAHLSVPDENTLHVLLGFTVKGSLSQDIFSAAETESRRVRDCLVYVKD